jgi:hypothetical protein
LWILASIDGILSGFCVENYGHVDFFFLYYDYFYYAFLTLSETNCFHKVREGRSNGNVVDGENFDGIAEVMLIVQVTYELFGECAGYYLYKNVVGITLLV